MSPRTLSCRISATTNDGWSPLHIACANEYNTLNIVQILIDRAPDSVRIVTKDKGLMPIHALCNINKMKEKTTIEILKLLIEKHHGAVRHANNDGNLPIHIASVRRSPAFCRVLIEAYPGSERMSNDRGMFPFHLACYYNTVATVEYLYKLFPDAINHAGKGGFYPIHGTIKKYCYTKGYTHGHHHEMAAEMIEFLLDCDPSVKFQMTNRQSLLAWTAEHNIFDSNIETGMQVIKVLYDAHPESIESEDFVSKIQDYHQQLQTFINEQLVYARQAKDHRLMSTPDDNGHIPLHTALEKNVRLGSTKLLVKGNPVALQSPDNRGALPLHVACEHHDSPSVIQYLIRLDTSTLDAVDREGNTAFHYACRGAKFDTITLLLEKFDAVSVSKRNAHKKLPIDLLWESNEVLDRESVDFTESVFRLLKAYPETVMSRCIQKEQSVSVACSSQREKKRKVGHEE